MKHIYKYLFLAPVFILIQVLLLNNIYFLNYINPLVYIILIITLPKETEKWFILIFGFIIGILLDLFEGNIGLNASSLVFISFLKPYLQKFIIPKNSVDEKDKLNLQNLGIKTFSLFALTIIFAHNLFLFLLEHFTNTSILLLLVKILLSTLVTYIIILILQLFTFKNNEKT